MGYIAVSSVYIPPHPMSVERKEDVHIFAASMDGVPDFEGLHQKLWQQMANQLFLGQLKSYQRAFIAMTPDQVGLIDVGNIRSS